jgi:uncharacterized protein YcbK (DUF882 family)|tara:strand:- start:190 stop:543 length:354 start_codon:yes stop_codon:yes gene_type:complete
MKYFQYEEFDSPDIQGSGQLMSKELLSKLDMIREEFGKPIYINSGYRTEAHNEKVGGKPASSHLKGLAVDIACNASRDRFNLVNLFIKHDINRIGIAKNFIHVDIDGDKDQDVMWTY